MLARTRRAALLVLVLCSPAYARAAGPVGHVILAEKTLHEIASGSIAVPADIRQALTDPECRRAFRGGAVAPDICEETSHYGKTGELARNLVETARFYMERANQSGSPEEIKAEFGLYDDGQKDGLWTEWHENGQKKGEDEYQAGNRIRGKSKRWDDKGRPLQLVGDW
jgi:hypothetical protein